MEEDESEVVGGIRSSRRKEGAALTGAGIGYA